MDTSLEAMESSGMSSWMEEAMAWRQTFEQVTGHSIDSDLPSQAEPQLTFATFAKGCLQDGSSFKRNNTGKLTIPLCDSTRDRKQILLHMFGPLTKDVFSAKSTHQAFEHLGLNGEFDMLLQYYGEWFMSLSCAKIEKQCDGILCPVVRWLHDMVLEYMESPEYSKAKSEGKVLFLQVLHKYCSESPDLPRAFFLAVACHEAILSTTKNIEDRTYGLITCEDCGKYTPKTLGSTCHLLCISHPNSCHLVPSKSLEGSLAKYTSVSPYFASSAWYPNWNSPDYSSPR